MLIHNFLFKKYVYHEDTGGNDSQFKTNNRAIHSKEQKRFLTSTVKYIHTFFFANLNCYLPSISLKCSSKRERGFGPALDVLEAKAHCHPKCIVRILCS